MDPQKITELANLFRYNGDKILSSEFTLTLSGSLLRALNDSFTLIADSVEIGGPQQFQVTKPMNSKSPVFRDLQLVHDFVQKTTLLCITHYPTEEYFTGSIDISKFRALKRLEIRKVNVRQIVGIQPLRAQLQHLICIKSLESVDDIITHCGGDHSNGFVWNELKIADFSYNNLQTVDSSLEFAQYLQQLNLRHNKLRSVEALKWLPHLKSLDLSYNCLQCIPQFHTDAYKRLQTLNMSNNFVEDLVGIAKMDALTELDLSDNCLLDHSSLLPLSAVMTLKYLNLYGNPLHCHPKHRLATAQFLHKNTSTMKFLLDIEPLSKNEKAITGKQQLRHVGSLSRYAIQSSSASISSSRRLTPSSQTPASSIGSLHSFKFQDSTATGNVTPEVVGVSKKKSSKMRMVEIEDDKTATDQTDENNAHALLDNVDDIVALNSKSTQRVRKKDKPTILTQSLLDEASMEHLEAKKHIENLRDKYGSEWLQSGKAEMMHSVLGIESNGLSPKNTDEQEREISRALFNDYLGEFSATAMDHQAQLNSTTSTPAISTSTPINEHKILDPNQDKMPSCTPIKASNNPQQNDDTLYLSVDNSQSTTLSSNNDEKSLYKTADENNMEQVNVSNEQQTIAIEEDPKEVELRNIYATSANVESEDSEPEDEETYIVYTDKSNNALFLTLSENFLREKDTWTQRTKAKWSIKILESCDRLKANTIRINFDTVKTDKKERIYTVEDGLCQELEKKLRNILSKRDLTEMNQTIYRCVNCSCQFSRENKLSPSFPKQDLRCPDCNSTFIAEIHDIPKSLDKVQEQTLIEEKLSPAAIVEESPMTRPLVLIQSSTSTSLQPQQSVDSMEGEAEYSNSIASKRLTAINPSRTRSKGKQTKKSSANSLNESSSCSKISVHSQSSFDSNQSVVGSTNSERDLEFNINCESDVDIISNPSQSSIEVLDQMFFDGRISQQPNLETIADNSYKQSFTDWPVNMTQSDVGPTVRAVESENMENASMKTLINGDHQAKVKAVVTSVVSPLTHLQLTESSSSGSVTDSICTTYAATKSQSNDEKIAASLLLTNERISESVTETNKENDQKLLNKEHTKKEDTSLTSMFGAIFQSTNILMSSSKKLIEAETTANIKPGEKLPSNSGSASKTTNNIVPYKFNYTDFNDIDHRLKLYFYQEKFEDEGEHFKWLVRGRIYNENTKALCTGIVAMSNSRLYLMEAFAPENDVITKWLRPIVSVSMDRLETVQLLPWKIGCSFAVRNWGGFFLLLQDILHTDSLLLYFANNNLPIQCELLYQPAECITKRLNDAVNGEKLNMFALLNGCEISCDTAKRNFQLCGLLTTDSHLYLTTDKLTWLSINKNTAPDDLELERCVTQFMSNLVDVEQIADTIRAINFLDETQNTCEVWKLTFETKENADTCLNAIGQAWQQLFGVLLFGT